MILITSCTSSSLVPVGKIKDSDLISKTIILNTSISKTLNILYKSMRYCRGEEVHWWGKITFVRYGADPECIKEEDGSYLCDIYLLQGQHEYGIMGIIQLHPHGEGTSAILSVFKESKNPENTLNIWEQFLQGKYKDVCQE